MFTGDSSSLDIEPILTENSMGKNESHENLAMSLLTVLEHNVE